MPEPKRPPPPFSLEKKEFHEKGPWTFATTPSVVHFDGFQIGQIHKQTINLVNIADFGQRMHVIKTQNSHFKTITRNKKGLIPPGLSEEIEIEFKPSEWRYYYDCIRIHTEDGNMLIPIHAYPTLNEIKFPRRIDFGRCDLSESKKKKFKLECKVPLDFEYKVEFLGEGSPEFEVSPTAGVISSSKPAEIVVSFQPMKSATSTVQLKVIVATSNSKPVICEITGSGYPGSLNAQISKTSTIDPANLTAEELLSLSTEKKRSKAPKKHKYGQGKLSPGLRGTVRRLDGPGFHTGMKDSGILFPDLNKLSTHHGVNKVLNQQQERKVYEKEWNDEQLRTLLPEKDKLKLFEDKLHPLDDWSLNHQLKEKVFQEMWDEKHRSERVSMMGTKSVGEEEFSHEKVAFFKNLLQKQAEDHLQAKVEKALSNNVDEVDVVSKAEPYIPQKSDQEIIGEVNPRFDPAINDTWRMRATVIERFIQAARKVIYRNKMDKRLQKLNDWLNKHARNKKLIADAVENDNVERGRSFKTEHNLDLVYPVPENLELYRSHETDDLTFKFTSDLEVPRIESYSEIEKYPLKEIFEYKTMGYQEEAFEDFLTYIPPIEIEELMEGAVEEYDYDIPTSDVPEIEDVIPESLEISKAPSAQLSISDKLFISEYQVRYQEPSLWGLDVDYPIEPRIFTHRVSYLEEETYQNTVVSMSTLPAYSKTLSDFYVAQRKVKALLPDHIPDPMEGPEDISFGDDPDVEAKEEERQKRLQALPSMDEIMKKYDLSNNKSNQSAEDDDASPAEGEESKESAAGPSFVHPYERAMSQLSEFMNKEYSQTTDKTCKLVQDYNAVLKFPSISKVVFGSFPTSSGEGGESLEE